jgi:magnesium transporter
MPLTWIVGFFGMNFAWMVRTLDGWAPFVLLGVVTQVVTVGVMLVLFRRRRWI